MVSKLNVLSPWGSKLKLNDQTKYLTSWLHRRLIAKYLYKTCFFLIIFFFPSAQTYALILYSYEQG